jgi:replicative DNA helicase
VQSAGAPALSIPLAGPDALTEATANEAALLGCALAWPPAAPAVLGDLGRADLGEPVHRALLTAITHLHPAPPEPALVLADLRRHAIPAPPDRGWAVVLADLIGAACVPAAAVHHHRAVLEARYRRQAADHATRVHQAATSGALLAVHTATHDLLTDLAATLARLTPDPAPTARPGLRDAA